MIRIRWRPSRPSSATVPVRVRLLAGVIVLSVLGPAGAAVATNSMLRSYLDRRSQGRLPVISAQIDTALHRRTDWQQIETAMQTLSAGRVQIAYLNRRGQLISPPSRYGGTPARVALGHLFTPGVPPAFLRQPDRPIVMTLAGRPHAVLYHPSSGVLVDLGSGTDYDVGAIALSYSTSVEDETLQRLTISQLVAALVTLLVMLALSVVVLRAGLRPLATMAETASAIAAGDITRRVRVVGRRTETGQLAVALNQAFDERQRAEDRLRDFIADASHELRTPLTTIRGWADLYFQGALRDPAGVETAMTRIADEAAQVSRLVEELLVLARLDRRRQLDTTLVDLTAMAGELVADARVIDPTREITLATSPSDGATVIAGDADQMRRVVRNLVGNAVQHTPPGTPVTVQVGRDPAAPDDRVLLRVADGGPGIPEHEVGMLFERFYRASRANPAGTGLGLSIVQAIVAAHDGTIEVRSHPGQGTTFDVTLPVVGTRRPS